MLAGDWWGTLKAGGQRLRLLVTFAQAGESYTGTVFSVDQGNAEIAMANIELTATSLTFDVPQVAGSYRGLWQDGKWVGSWMQGAPLPLTLVRGRPEVKATKAPSVPEDWTLPGEAEVAERLAAYTSGEGVVGAAALVENGEVRTVLSEGFDPQARFEIGSVTKVFTSLLLADLVLDGTVSLDDTLGDHVAGIANETVASITLRQLANHRSGLPRLPANLLPMAAQPDPYAAYDETMLLEWIRTVEPARAPDEGFEYSNGATGLLGWVLGKAGGSDYKSAIVERITGPMGLADTDFSTTRAYSGFTAGEPSAPWTFDSLAGAGALRSTIADFATFAGILAAPPERWRPHVELMTATQSEAGNGMTIGLGLFTIPVTEDGVLFHNGGTGGFKTTMWADSTTGRAVVANVNDAGADLDKLGLWMIAGVER